MRLAIISDVHSNLEALQATLDDISAQAADRIICLGDIVGYNTDPAECIALLQKKGVACVAGNHDRAVCEQITTDDFGFVGARAILWTRRRLGSEAVSFLAGLPLKAEISDELIAVHGALHPEKGCETVRLDDDERRRQSFEALMKHPSGIRICAFGHTHRLGVFEWQDSVPRQLHGDEINLKEGAFYLVNPGSVGESRTSDPRATYLVLDTARQAIEVKRVSYDWSVPLAKKRRAGLMPPLATLPQPLRAALRRYLVVLGLYDAVRKWQVSSLGERLRHFIRTDLRR
ncbi:metallophosphatase family protein [Mesorhizobium sp. LMG 17147]|uniref:metallophosphoesterase family protein n=1 Tax=Mesorhizobium sp. LMG 17147 TaxID=2963091 RepID=UPI0020C94FF4|nr:metallophosphoesterase family protein [Mesorhizobium sp. LMG 17147]MCP9234046.1 metallophosphatase family protein [Mesorhizobium sp. LMG 17147]